jgi:hypothetical protein
MAGSPLEAVERAIGDAGLSRQEAELVLEIGYLAMIADGPLTSPELDAFARVSKRLMGPHGEAPAEDLLDAFSDAVVKVGVEQRLVDRAARLQRPEAKRHAYQIASALSLCDLASNDRERAFDTQLVEALGLSEAEADALAMDAYATITVA